MGCGAGSDGLVPRTGRRLPRGFMEGDPGVDGAIFPEAVPPGISDVSAVGGCRVQGRVAGEGGAKGGRSGEGRD